MSGVVFSASLDGAASHLAAARAMAAAGAYRSRAGVRESATSQAIAISLDGAEEPGLTRSGPRQTPDGSLLLVADARIDNRDDLAAALDCRDVATRRDDAALLLNAYLRWGDGFAERLLGDYSVVIWDERRRRLVATRDAQGLRPLVYRIEPRRILVSSDVTQMLAAPDVPNRPFEPHLAALLVGSAGMPAWTFHEGVDRLPPGHTLIADANGVSVVDHRTVVIDDEPRVSVDEYASRFRAQLAEAVHARVAATPRAGLLLSGGLDSLSVCGTFGSLRHARAVCSQLWTYSFAYADLPQCDERDVSTIVTDHYNLPNVPVPAGDAWPLAEHPQHAPYADGPFRLRSHVAMDRAVELACRDEVTVLMVGQRGDALVGYNVFDYLGRLRHGGPHAVWRDLQHHSRRTAYSTSALFKHYVVRHLAAAVWPRGFAAAARRRARRGWHARRSFPAWIPPDAVRRFALEDVAEQMVPASPLSGEARRRRHQNILDPALARDVEGMERLFAHAGIRYADPWTDARLATLVLQIPQYVLSPAGEPKQLLREAMRGVLPEAARLAAAKRTPQPQYERALRDRARNVVWSLIEGSQAAARGYVDQRVLREAYTRMLTPSYHPDDSEWRHLWRFINVEEWLRRYHSAAPVDLLRQSQ